jgi:hypothetical protein
MYMENEFEGIANETSEQDLLIEQFIAGDVSEEEAVHTITEKNDPDFTGKIIAEINFITEGIALPTEGDSAVSEEVEQEKVATIQKLISLREKLEK